MIKHTAQLAHAVPLISLAYEFPLAPARTIDTILTCPKAIAGCPGGGTRG